MCQRTFQGAAVAATPMVAAVPQHVHPTCSASWSALRRSATFSSSSRPGLCVLFSVCWLLHQEKKGAELEWKGVETGGGSEVCGTACPRDLHRRWVWLWRQRRAAAPFSQFSQFFTFFAHDWQQQAEQWGAVCSKHRLSSTLIIYPI